MRWPFVSRARFDVLCNAHADLNERVVATEAREAYWRERAEKLIDAGLMRAQAIGGPTMAPAPKIDPSEGSPLRGMLLAEIPKTAVTS